MSVNITLAVTIIILTGDNFRISYHLEVAAIINTRVVLAAQISYHRKLFQCWVSPLSCIHHKSS